jgi:hypothetical protein
MSPPTLFMDVSRLLVQTEPTLLDGAQSVKISHTALLASALLSTLQDESPGDE